MLDEGEHRIFTRKGSDLLMKMVRNTGCFCVHIRMYTIGLSLLYELPYVLYSPILQYVLYSPILQYVLYSPISAVKISRKLAQL